MLHYVFMQPITERRARLAELIDSASNGSESAFVELHAMTKTYLYSVALRILPSAPQAEEVLQEAYLAVWQHLKRYQPGFGSPMTWLITIVRNQAINALRAQTKNCATVSLDEDSSIIDAWAAEMAVARDPIEDAFYATSHSRLAAAMASLEPAERQALTLTFQHGLAHRELSDHLQVPLGTAKSWVRRGMARLTRYVSATDVDSGKKRKKINIMIASS